LLALQTHFGILADDTKLQEASEADIDQTSSPRERPIWLNELESLLAKGSFAATDIWQDKQSELGGVIDSHTRKKINTALDNFEFDAALALVRGSKSPDESK
jgi:hypothetical protein